MIGHLCIGEILLVAGKTIFGNVSKNLRLVAGGTLGNSMSHLQREKTMVHYIGIPCIAGKTVAIRAIRAEIIFYVIRISGIFKIIPVAVITGDTDGAETNVGFTHVAGTTINERMYPNQRKSRVFVKFSDVFHDPALRGMASGAIISRGLLMHVFMAGHTGAFSFFKFECLMAGAAIESGMPACQ